MKYYRATMAYDEKLAQRVRTILAERRGVSEKTLMGSLAFMVGGRLCCSVGRDSLLIRVDAEDRERLLSEPLVSPMKLGGRTMQGFVRIAPEGVRTRARLAKWIEQGIAAGAVVRRKRGASR